MTELGSSGPACANCRQPLDATDKYCRECGLPTLRQATAQRAVPTHAPGMPVARLGLEVMPDPQPFVRHAGDATRPVEASGELTTGGVVRVTSPTMVTQMGLSTVLMVGLIVLLAVGGVILLVLAFRG
jgi:hypothetical protein